MHDLLIRRGSIVDGTGRAAYEADVAVDSGRITAIDQGLAPKATRVIDARGAIVTPGFVDIHTHYDGQATWDAVLEPSASHGVTTVIAGNCGVGFAPVRPGAQSELVELMEGVEDIPGIALYEGIEWSWETFPQYLDLLATKRWSMDVGTHVPHGAVRAYVMGEHGIRNEASNAADIAQMAAITRDAIAAGALGFSTSRILGHQSIRGLPVPGTFASEDEVFAIGEAMAASGSVFELVPGGSVGQGGMRLGANEAQLDAELDWMARLSRRTRLPITFLVVEFQENPDAWKHVLRFVAVANANGARLYPQTAARPGGLLLGFQSNHLFQRRPTYLEFAALPLTERIAQLRRPEVRAAILAERDLPPLSASINDALHIIIGQSLEDIFPLGDPVDYEPPLDTAVAAQARRDGVEPQARIYDLMLENDGRAMLLLPTLNFARRNQDALYGMLSDPNTVVGLGDGGAHCNLICDASSTTYLLTHWVRDRRGPRLTLEHAIKKQCADNADLYGLSDRGRLELGKRADINVIDFDRLELGQPYLTNDLPAGGTRFLQRARGYRATIVAGDVTREADCDTGARPGRLLRGRR
jgi:N-acyl-D-aspartate/D-glutamate deacylase